MIRTIILFIIIFSIVVISHELGHFLIGRRNGIRVVEFSVGMGPTLFSFIKGGVKYSLKLLPIGGACMFDGEDGMDREEKEEAGGMHRRAGVEAQLPLSSETTDQRYGRVDLDAQGIAFPEAGVWRRIATVFAGPFFNFILAFVVAVVLILALVGVLMAVAMPKFKKMQTLVDRMNLVSREILTGVPVIRAARRQNHTDQS